MEKWKTNWKLGNIWGSYIGVILGLGSEVLFNSCAFLGWVAGHEVLLKYIYFHIASWLSILGKLQQLSLVAVQELSD